jgi:hypothetical protein
LRRLRTKLFGHVAAERLVVLNVGFAEVVSILVLPKRALRDGMRDSVSP